MADETANGTLPPASEEIHLPDPAYTPVVLAFGIMLVVVGVVLTWVIVAIGLIVVAVSLTRWIRQAREEMADLPLEH